jgi:methylenetetrahydrofolate--tRNA-(uracil-5-)-methyltransferase
MQQNKVIVIGGGLAGCEAAHFLASRGIAVTLFEMRPTQTTEAHKTETLAELVCSNSFKSLSLVTAPGILKQEMELLGSLAMQCSKLASVQAGEALAVDRDIFSAAMQKAIYSHPLITVKREELMEIPQDPNTLCILATGPLTSPSLTASLQAITGDESFYFYDAISPVIDGASINWEKVYVANRYDKPTRSIDQTTEVTTDGDYVNCPMNREEYQNFIDLIKRSERVETKNFERLKHFEGCMPIEEMVDRGDNTPRFGPMKPVGLIDPRTGNEPWAAVQLRTENRSRTAFNIVGFQTKLKYGEQAKVFRTIPGLENAEFLRLGSMHRNSFVDAPRVLNADLSLRKARHVLLAGQITGVEGYMESASVGILAGIFAEARLKNLPIPAPPAASALGSLLAHLSNPRNMDYQPTGINFGIFEDDVFADALLPLKTRFPKKIPKPDKREALGKLAIKNAAAYAQRLGLLKL